jgi:hypothetical protein
MERAAAIYRAWLAHRDVRLRISVLPPAKLRYLVNADRFREAVADLRDAADSVYKVYFYEMLIDQERAM